MSQVEDTMCAAGKLAIMQASTRHHHNESPAYIGISVEPRVWIEGVEATAEALLWAVGAWPGVKVEKHQANGTNGDYARDGEYKAYMLRWDHETKNGNVYHPAVKVIQV